MSARAGLAGLVLFLTALSGAFPLIPNAGGETPLSLPNSRITGATGDTWRDMEYPMSMAAWESVVVVLYGDNSMWKPGEVSPRSFVQVAVSCDYGKTFIESGDLPRTSDYEQVFWATVGVLDGTFYVADVLDSTLADFNWGDRIAL